MYILSTCTDLQLLVDFKIFSKAITKLLREVLSLHVFKEASLLELFVTQEQKKTLCIRT